MSTQTTPTARDEAAAARIVKHHTHLAADLERLAGAVAAATDAASFAATKQELSTWLHGELAPHAAGEEVTFYQAAGALPAGKLLVDAMVSEHRVILGFVEQLDAAQDQAAAAAWANALLRLFSHHAAQENESIIPLLVAEPSVNLEALLHEMHEH